MAAARSNTLFVVLSWVFPIALLVTALTRLILPSFFYLFSFFHFLLFPPLTLCPSPQPASLNSSTPARHATSSTTGSPSSHQSHSTHAHTVTCYYTHRPLYFLFHLVVPSLFLFSHLLGAVLFQFDVLTSDPFLSFLGLTPFDSLSSSLLLVLPDLLFLVFAGASFFLLRRSPSPSVHVDLETLQTVWDVLSFFLLLFAGIMYISLAALPYFLLFIAVLLHLSFQSYTYRHGHITSMPATSSPFLSSSFHLTALSTSITAVLPAYTAHLVVFFSYYIPLHLTLLFAYQFLSLHDGPDDSLWKPSIVPVNLLGLYSPTSVGLFKPTWTAYLGTVMHVGLLRAVCERRDRRRMTALRIRAHQPPEEDEEEEEEVEAEEKAQHPKHRTTASDAQDGDGERKQRDSSGGKGNQYGAILGDLTVGLLAEGALPSDKAPPSTPAASRHPNGSPRHSPVEASTSEVTHSRGIALRHFLLRVSRYSGRFLCSLLLGITVFTLPSLLAIMLLILLVASLLTSSSLFTRLAPYYLFFLLFTSFVLYLFSIPSLFPKNDYLTLIGISHTHLPFIYVLDYISPILAFSAFLITSPNTHHPHPSWHSPPPLPPSHFPPFPCAVTG